MDRRQMIARLPLAGVAAALPVVAAAATEAAQYPLAAELAQAIATETAAYLRGGADGLPDEEANDVTARVAAIAWRLHTLPPVGDDYRLATALATKWNLVSEGTYYSDYWGDQITCGLVDSILSGSPFDDDHLPMLWHVHGGPFINRPAPEVLDAVREAGR